MKPFSAMPAYQEIIDVLRSAVSDTGLITCLLYTSPSSRRAAILAMSEAPRLNPAPPQRQHDELSSFSSAT